MIARLLLVSAVAAVATLRGAPGGDPVPSDFLHAIRLVESGDRYDTPAGKGGELGPYQFRFPVWRSYTSAPFSRACTPLADDVAARHYRWIGRRLRANGLAATPWNIAAVWNSGLRSVLSGRIPPATRDYASRVVNLMELDASIRRSRDSAPSVASSGEPAAAP
jgi:hypothetical protein